MGTSREDFFPFDFFFPSVFTVSVWRRRWKRRISAGLPYMYGPRYEGEKIEY